MIADTLQDSYLLSDNITHHKGSPIQATKTLRVGRGIAQPNLRPRD